MGDYIDLCKRHNLPISKNGIGASGENIAKAILEYLQAFRVVFLGEKFPVVAFYVEINDAENSYPFMVQVKATTSELTKRKHLHVTVPKDKYLQLHKKPIPTYVGGVHIDTATLYITPTMTGKEKISTIAPDCVLSLDGKEANLDNVLRIKNDVMAYWDSLDAKNKKAAYKSLLTV